ncbi:helix-turn-helix domain-containing protein [Alicyclobacillus dauci]|uniref:DUF4115 domain-containing protein n=1 Tax=Alicyclobacillus dauci TaxID=1475485 RepID=A0ABY6YXL6_9BACL|nr:RodZ domain-containing protein [Alicyclobacillus dauci]WAH35344.1 DUF4115 domain-containing protein [Alicyclobacillus dauci]
MRELGRILRTTRESQGFDLDQIEEKTKIRKRYLLALEEGDWTVLPGRVYARGFVRSYADVLGLDGLDLLQKYVDGREIDADSGMNEETRSDSPLSNAGKQAEVKRTDEVSDKQAAEPRKPAVQMSEPRTITNSKEMQKQRPVPTRGESKMRVRPGGAIGQALIICAALVVVGGGYFALRNQLGGHHTTGQPSSQTIANEPPVASNGTSNRAAIGGVNTTGNGVASATANTVSNSSVSGQSQPKAVVITPQPLQNGIRTYLVKNVSQLQVNLQVLSGQCWISATVDGNVTDGNDTVNQGQTRTFQGKQTVSLRLGHVQGVQLTVNGQQLVLPNTQSAVNIQIQKQQG